jgi:hypothetical protein
LDGGEATAVVVHGRLAPVVESAVLPFDVRILLTAPEAVLVHRLGTRITNGYGATPQERAQVLADLAQVEPLLRRSADLVLRTDTATPDELADVITAHVRRSTA